jgi:hypothetical protein
MNLSGLHALIHEVIVDANGEDQQLWAFRQGFEDALSPPDIPRIGMTFDGTHSAYELQRIYSLFLADGLR